MHIPQKKGKHSGKINWADFQNLLFFYALGKLHPADSDEIIAQKQIDLEDLRSAIEKVPELKNQKSQTAEQRINRKKANTYLLFAMNVIDSIFNNNSAQKYDLEREIQDAEETNSFNAAKLKRSKSTATLVCDVLKNRYKKFK